MSNESWKKDLHNIGSRDADTLIRKNAEYGNSWAARGGAGAFFVTARKWDRIENQVKSHGYDVFAALKADTRPEGLIDDVRDLRAYLMLIEAEMLSWGVDLIAPATFAVGTRVRSILTGNTGITTGAGAVRWDNIDSSTFPAAESLELLPEKVGCRTYELSDRLVPRQQPYGYNGEE